MTALAQLLEPTQAMPPVPSSGFARKSFAPTEKPKLPEAYWIGGAADAGMSLFSDNVPTVTFIGAVLGSTTCPTRSGARGDSYWAMHNAAFQTAFDIDILTFVGFNTGDHILGIAADVARLSVDWDGQGGLAPSEQTVRSIESVASLLPPQTRAPEAEVDGGDGSVSLRWFGADGASVFSLTISNFEIVGVLTGVNRPVEGWRLTRGDGPRIARLLADVDHLLTHA